MATDGHLADDDEPFLDEGEDLAAGPDEEFGGDEDQDALEARARQLGWKPLAEFRGPPHLWTDAPTFIEKGERELPILRDQNRRMSERLARLEPEMERLTRTTAEQATAIQDAMNLARRADERGYQRGLTELKAKQREAVEAGDTEAFDQIEEQIGAMQQARTETASPPPPPAAPPPPNGQVVPPEIEQFAEDNRWWNRDRALSQAMIGHHQVVMATRPGLSLAEQLEEARQRVVADFPDSPFFAGEAQVGADDELNEREPPMRQPQRPAAPPRRPGAAPALRPQGAGGTGQPPRQRSGFDTIADPQERAEARAAFQRIKVQQPTITVAEYMAIYDDPHGDVLATLSRK